MDETLKINVSETLLDLYCLYRQKWVMMTDPKKSKTPTRTILKKYDFMQIYNHICGDYSVAVFAGEKATKFLCFDVDDGNPETVRRIIATLEDVGIPREYVYVSLSGGKGYHVEIFFKDFLFNNIAKSLYGIVIERGGFDKQKVEYRPSHTMAIKLPLGIHQKTKRRCWFVDRETLEPIEDFEYINQIERIDSKIVEDIIKNIVNEHMRSIYNEIAESRKKKRTNEKKMTMHYDSLVVTEPGTRHNIQARVAARARKDGCDWQEIVDRQMQWYREQNQSLINSTEAEVRADAIELANWAIDKVEVKNNVIMPVRDFKVATIENRMIPYILKSPTKSARMVIFLLFIYTNRYGEIRMSQKTIAEQIGVSVATVKKAINWLSENKYIICKPQRVRFHEFLRLKAASLYYCPGEKKFRVPKDDKMYLDHMDLTGMITPENFYDTYISVLATMCKLEYLAKYLSKPELRDCKAYAERMAVDGTEDTGCGA